MSHEAFCEQVANVTVVTWAGRSNHKNVTWLRLFNCHVNRPVVAWSYGAGQCIAGNLGRKDWAKAVIQEPDATLGLVDCGNAKLG
jgi:hypothetical protein